MSTGPQLPHQRDRDKTRRAPMRTGPRLPHRRDRDRDRDMGQNKAGTDEGGATTSFFGQGQDEAGTDECTVFQFHEWESHSESERPTAAHQTEPKRDAIAE
jgi:hypothetical protein